MMSSSRIRSICFIPFSISSSFNKASSLSSTSLEISFSTIWLLGPRTWILSLGTNLRCIWFSTWPPIPAHSEKKPWQTNSATRPMLSWRREAWITGSGASEYSVPHWLYPWIRPQRPRVDFRGLIKTTMRKMSWWRTHFSLFKSTSPITCSAFHWWLPWSNSWSSQTSRDWRENTIPSCWGTHTSLSQKQSWHFWRPGSKESCLRMTSVPKRANSSRLTTSVARPSNPWTRAPSISMGGLRSGTTSATSAPRIKHDDRCNDLILKHIHESLMSFTDLT